MYKLQTNMQMVEKHAIELSKKEGKKEKGAIRGGSNVAGNPYSQNNSLEKDRFHVIGSPTPERRFGAKIHINKAGERRSLGGDAPSG